MLVVSGRRFQAALLLILNTAEPEGHALIEFLTIWEAEGKKMRTIKQRTKWLEKKCKELKEESEVCFRHALS